MRGDFKRSQCNREGHDMTMEKKSEIRQVILLKRNIDTHTYIERKMGTFLDEDIFENELEI